MWSSAVMATWLHIAYKIKTPHPGILLHLNPCFTGLVFNCSLSSGPHSWTSSLASPENILGREILSPNSRPIDSVTLGMGLNSQCLTSLFRWFWYVHMHNKAWSNSWVHIMCSDCSHFLILAHPLSSHYHQFPVFSKLYWFFLYFPHPHNTCFIIKYVFISVYILCKFILNSFKMELHQ